ncbi:winged helix-turn-helix domain-containing protein [Enterovibrio norvegicus]|uniref:winged helix-turn-helix domain-containing protein n=1 Tax=Enterovibrio norvegicus TaxID=188144 RepID=UPI0012FFD71C|nr:winged helix-turn-helix domain-containing protein [Enterovibrio norvegicus]
MNFTGIAALDLACTECPTSYRVFSVMMLCSNEKNVIAASQQMLADKLKVSKGVVNKAVKALTKNGLVAYHAVRGGHGSYFMVNPYEWSVIPRHNGARGYVVTGEISESECNGANYALMCEQYKEMGGLIAGKLDAVKQHMKAMDTFEEIPTHVGR